MPFKTKYSFETRKNTSSKILHEHNGERIPIVVEKLKKDPTILEKTFGKKNINETEDHIIRCIAKGSDSFGAFQCNVREMILSKPEHKLHPNETLFFLVNNSMLPTGCMISQIYEKYKDEDGLLYVFWDKENTFGL